MSSGRLLFWSGRTFKHYSLNHLQSQEPKAEGSKVRAALFFFKLRVCSSFDHFIFFLLPSLPLLSSRLTSFCEKSAVPHAVQSGIWVNLFMQVAENKKKEKQCGVFWLVNESEAVFLKITQKAFSFQSSRTFAMSAIESARCTFFKLNESHKVKAENTSGFTFGLTVHYLNTLPEATRCHSVTL